MAVIPTLRFCCSSASTLKTTFSSILPVPSLELVLLSWPSQHTIACDYNPASSSSAIMNTSTTTTKRPITSFLACMRFSSTTWMRFRGSRELGTPLFIGRLKTSSLVMKPRRLAALSFAFSTLFIISRLARACFVSGCSFFILSLLLLLQQQQQKNMHHWPQVGLRACTLYSCPSSGKRISVPSRCFRGS